MHDLDVDMDPTKLGGLSSQGILTSQAQLNNFAGQQSLGLAGQAQNLGVPLDSPLTTPRKRRKIDDGQQVSVTSPGSDNEGGTGSKPSTTGPKQSIVAKRSQHCEVEKKRRERMNRYMTELAQMIPACGVVPRKLDKLSILKMAVDHMKNLRGDPNSNSDYKPGFLTDDELKKLIVEAANGFMMIIECSQAKVLFVSDTIRDVLKENPEQWIGSCLYDKLHHKALQSLFGACNKKKHPKISSSADIVKVREQLSCFDIDKTLTASGSSSVKNSPLVTHSNSMNGLRRSFLCRMKRTTSKNGTEREDTHPTQSDSTSSESLKNSEKGIKLLHPSHEGNHYAVLHCTGFIRTPSETEMELTPSSAKLPSKSVSIGTNAMLDEIELHFQRSLAQAKQQAQLSVSSGGTPSTTHTPSTSHTPSTLPSSHSHRQLVDTNHQEKPTHSQPHSLSVKNTTSSSHRMEPDTSKFTSKSLDNEQHRIVRTLNHAASTASPASVTIGTSSNLLTSAANGLQYGDHTPSRPVPHMKASNFVNIPLTQANVFANALGLGSISATQNSQLHGLPVPHMIKPPEGILTSMQGGAVLNPGGTVISEQVLQQLLAQQSLLQLQQQQQQQGAGMVKLAASPASLSLVPPSPQLATIAASLGPRASSTVVSATMTQPTPSVTSSLLSSQHVSSGGQVQSPLVLPKLFDPTPSQHLMTGTGSSSGSSPVILLSSAGSMPFVQPQPFIVVNPSDLSTFQHPQQGMNLVGSRIIPNPGGGLILLSPGPGTTSFTPPLINLGGATFPNTMQQLYMYPGSSSSVITAPTSNQPSTPKKNTPSTISSHQKITPLKYLTGRRTSLESISPGADDSDDVMLTPASVEDHFAKALGDEWSKLQTQKDLTQALQPSHNQYTVAS